MVQANGIEPLIALLNDSKFEPQANAAVSLTNVAADGSYKFIISTIRKLVISIKLLINILCTSFRGLSRRNPEIRCSAISGECIAV